MSMKRLITDGISQCLGSTPRAHLSLSLLGCIHEAMDSRPPTRSILLHCTQLFCLIKFLLKGIFKLKML